MRIKIKLLRLKLIKRHNKGKPACRAYTNTPIHQSLCHGTHNTANDTGGGLKIFAKKEPVEYTTKVGGETSVITISPPESDDYFFECFSTALTDWSTFCTLLKSCLVPKKAATGLSSMITTK